MADVWVLIATCIYVFAKSETDNVSQKQLGDLKLLAKTLLGMNEQDITKAIKTGALEEI